MRYPRSINVKHIYLAFFSIVSIALFAFTMLIYGQYKKVQILNSNTVRQYEAIRQSRTILIDLVDMETGVRGFVITGDAHFLAPYTAASGRLRNEVIALRYATYWEGKTFAETNDWLDRIADIQKLLAAQVDAREHSRDVLPTMDLEKQRIETDGLRQGLEKSVARRMHELSVHSKDADIQKRNFVYILILGTITGIGILLIGTVTVLKLETERERLEDETEKAETRFRRVMHGINDGLYELNFVNESFYASKEFKAMLGYDESELENTIDMATGLIHPEDLPLALDVRRQYIMKQTPHYTNIFRMKHKDGTWRWMMSRGVGTWDKFGQIRSIIGTHTDITEQKAREEEFKQLHADMEAFTYITSHDMRAPLVNLKGFSHELSLAVKEISSLIAPEGGKLTAKNRERANVILNTDIPEALGFIGNAVDRMDTLTTAILDLSRIGKYVYRDQLVDAQAVFDKCLGAQSYEIAEKKVEVVVEPLPVLVTDPVALEQILGNLLDNAVKFLRPDQPGRIAVACHETGRDFVFSIRDNGRGIEAEDSARVFHIFRRARNTGNVRGLGLGMAFVKATLRKLGGAIWFDSTVDVGTTFYVSLPKKAAPAGTGIPTQTIAPPETGAANADTPRAMAG